MRLLFFRGHGLLATLTRFFTWGPYAHVALDTGSGNLIESAPFKGVREVALTEHRIQQADQFFVRVTQTEQAAILRYLRGQIGKGYDYLGVLRFIPRIGKANPYNPVSRWFCSDILFAAFLLAGVRLLRRVNINKVHPSLLAYSSMLLPEDEYYPRKYSSAPHCACKRK